MTNNNRSKKDRILLAALNISQRHKDGRIPLDLLKFRVKEEGINVQRDYVSEVMRESEDYEKRKDEYGTYYVPIRVCAESEANDLYHKIFGITPSEGPSKSSAKFDEVFSAIDLGKPFQHKFNETMDEYKTQEIKTKVRNVDEAQGERIVTVQVHNGEKVNSGIFLFSNDVSHEALGRELTNVLIRLL